jgi:hypothetical protein
MLNNEIVNLVHVCGGEFGKINSKSDLEFVVAHNPVCADKITVRQAKLQRNA